MILQPLSGICRAADRRGAPLGKFSLLIRAPTGSGAPFSLQVHLGMTGQIGYLSPEPAFRLNTHLFFALDDGHELRYTDIAALEDSDSYKWRARKVFCRFGLDPLEATEEEFRASFVRGARASKRFS